MGAVVMVVPVMLLLLQVDAVAKSKGEEGEEPRVGNGKVHSVGAKKRCWLAYSKGGGKVLSVRLTCCKCLCGVSAFVYLCSS